jgi:hypothetical protein
VTPPTGSLSSPPNSPRPRHPRRQEA